MLYLGLSIRILNYLNKDQKIQKEIKNIPIQSESLNFILEDFIVDQEINFLTMAKEYAGNLQVDIISSEPSFYFYFKPNFNKKWLMHLLRNLLILFLILKKTETENCVRYTN